MVASTPSLQTTATRHRLYFYNAYDTLAHNKRQASLSLNAVVVQPKGVTEVFSMTIVINPDEIRSIASSCSASSQTIQQEAATMQRQMTSLREALSGIPNLAMADRFDEWQQLFSKLSTSLEESNQYLQGVVNSVENFVNSLGRQ